MSERLTDEALDIINFGAEVWTGKWKDRAAAWIEAYHATPADDLRAAQRLALHIELMEATGQKWPATTAGKVEAIRAALFALSQNGGAA